MHLICEHAPRPSPLTHHFAAAKVFFRNANRIKYPPHLGNSPAHRPQDAV